jgi:hypothetical protein
VDSSVCPSSGRRGVSGAQEGGKMTRTTMRRKLAAITLASAFAVSGVTASAAFGDNPHAGNSGHFKGSSTPCPQNQQQCPPQND